MSWLLRVSEVCQCSTLSGRNVSQGSLTPGLLLMQLAGAAGKGSRHDSGAASTLQLVVDLLVL